MTISAFKIIRLFIFGIMIAYMLTGCRKIKNIFDNKEESATIETQLADKNQEIEMGQSVNRICELATLKCFYHNVADFEEESSVLFKHGLFRYGYKKMWMEYDGTVEIGIDADRVRVSEPVNNTIDIYIPEARIISVYLDVDTLTEGITDTGLFTEITVDDRAEAVQAAQEKMKQEAEANHQLKVTARQNAKKLIENYVLRVGNQLGKSYKIHWVDN